MDRINWILAANDARHLPAPLASRLRIMPVRGPTRAEMLAFAAREIARRGLDEEVVETVAALVRVYPEGDERLNLRTVVRIIEDLVAIADTAEVQH
jgi:uncharacterized protein YcgI (DUF1989 family)